MSSNIRALQQLMPHIGAIRPLPSVCCPINEDIFGLSEKQKKLRKSIFNFARKDIVSIENGEEESDDEDDEEKNICFFTGNEPIKVDKDRKVLRGLGKLNLLGIIVKEKYGGSGGGHLDHIIIQEELSQASVVNALNYGNHTNHCIYPIHHFGSDDQKRKYLPKLCSGEHIGTMAMPKPDSDLELKDLKAVKHGSYYILNGIGYSHREDADIIIVYATTNPKVECGVTAFIVEKSFKGYISSQDFLVSQYAFYDCKVPVTNVLGECNKGTEVLITCLSLENVILAGGLIGFMQALCDTALEYAHMKQEYAKFEKKIAGMHTKLSASRNYLYTVARACDNGHFNIKDCSAATLYCTKTVGKLTSDAKGILSDNGPIDGFAKQLLDDMELYIGSIGTDNLRRMSILCMIELEYNIDVIDDSD